MIDPGHPFARPYQDLIAALENSIRDGVEQPDRFQETFKSAVTSYPLPRLAEDVTRLTGTVNRSFFVFRRNVDYRVSNNRVSWLPSTDPANPARLPDDGTRFEVEFTYRLRPSGLTDFNEGSVVGTLVRALARELALIYDQMDEVYRRAFIDQATGTALDNVVALLGIERNPARKATGHVTFSRRRPADRDVPIAAGTRVADGGGRTFVTTEQTVIRTGGSAAVVRVEAVEAGPQGNVNSHTIVVMPTPPRGVDGVTNDQPTAGGKDVEPDDQLRERAKHALETAGRATLNAMKFAILDVDGVDEVDVLDHQSDGSIPLGEVRVLFSGRATDEVRDNVQKTIDRTRAAGVLVTARMIDTVLISGTFNVIPAPVIAPGAADEFKSAVVAALAALGIGEALSVRRLNALVYDVDGLADVAEAQLVSTKRPPGNPDGTVTDPYVIERTELLRPDAGQIQVVVLASLNATDATVRGLPHAIDLQLFDTNARPVRFDRFAIDLQVTLTARSLTAPDQPPRSIGGTPQRLEFTAQSTSRLTLIREHITLPDPLLADVDLTRVNVIIRAGAFPGLKPVEDLTVDLSL